MKTYLDYVKSLEELAKSAAMLPLGDASDISELCNFSESVGFGKVLVFAPHPDDECIIGLLPLRLMLESGAEVCDVAVTLGSNLERRKGRLEELKSACDFLNWKLKVPVENGFDKITPATRESDSAYWQSCVEKVASLILAESPRVVFAPHSRDWNGTHKGTSLLVNDVLMLLGDEFKGLLIETEYWGSFDCANLMVEASAEHIASLMNALARHTKEVERNDYHIRMASWLSDNVRRGAELVGGQGGKAPKFAFATLYNVRKFKDGKLQSAFDGGKFLPLSVLAGSEL